VSTSREDFQQFRIHFDAMYVGGIPRLLNEDGAFLAFLATLTAIDALAGVFAPNRTSGERFRAFCSRFLPPVLGSRADDLWRFRNLMVHSFNPGPFVLVCHQSRLHLTAQATNKGDLTVLNAEDFYLALMSASHAYFEALVGEPELQRLFARRLADDDGGAPQIFAVQNPSV
jgi:hypothetical protein